ncbi:MAG: DegT/DnrJ/EryC1/StrS family aminotransferase [Blautia massiliensis (ex Durand et al. 2017)]|uniref:DegT/DnrJ/EryC1/StrS family aminotransferase n=1 Tax=Blautia massiliensis (ex Durand et al. 2017) TaxID=1737424 RepID=UPI0039929011
MFKESNKFEKFESKVWLSSPTMHGPEIEYVKEAYETNWMSTVGKNINEVEKLACEYIGCKYAIALSAGTASLHLAMKLAGIEAYGMPKVGHGALEGKKVFCSDMTFDATVNPVVYEGGEPVFIDTEYDTWNMDPEALEKAFEIYPDTKVVVIAHLYGTPGKIEELNAVIRKHGAILIEDAAESMGATYKGVQTGTFGKYNTISFNGNKIITGSSGGCFLTDDEEAANKVRKWSTQARENAAWYQHEELGYNYRMSNVVAGVVRGQFPYGSCIIYGSEYIKKEQNVFLPITYMYNEEAILYDSFLYKICMYSTLFIPFLMIDFQYTRLFRGSILVIYIFITQQINLLKKSDKLIVTIGLLLIMILVAIKLFGKGSGYFETLTMPIFQNNEVLYFLFK